MMPRLFCLMDGHRERPDARWVMDQGGHQGVTLRLWVFRVCSRCGRRRFTHDSGKVWETILVGPPGEGPRS